jgi:hypothetical protein
MRRLLRCHFPIERKGVVVAAVAVAATQLMKATKGD